MNEFMISGVIGVRGVVHPVVVMEYLAFLVYLVLLGEPWPILAELVWPEVK